MALEKWDHGPDGDPILHPYLGAEATGALHSGFLRVHYGTTHGISIETKTLQLHMTPAQMMELSGVLWELAQAIESEGPDTVQ